MDREEAIVLVKMMFAFWANGHGGNLASMETAKDMEISALRADHIGDDADMMKAAHIDREAWTAEWIYPENEWNLPKCSKCGCNSKDAQYGHKNNFCPKCGRAMTPEAWAELEKRLRG